MASKAQPQPYKAPVYNEHFKTSSVLTLNAILMEVISALIFALSTKMANPTKYIDMLDKVWDTKKDHHLAVKAIRTQMRQNKFPGIVGEHIERYLYAYGEFIKSDMPTGFEPGSPSEEAAYLAAQPQ